MQPPLPSRADDVQQALETAGIIHAQDILYAQPRQIYQRLSTDGPSLRHLTELKARVAELVSAPVRRGDELFIREEERECARDTCLCGIDELDGLLGGFGKHGIIEISGGKRSGKTGLVLQIVLRHLAFYPHHTVFWLDVHGEFTVERAIEILRLNPGPGSETALDRLNISTCFDLAATHQVLEELRITLTHEHKGLLRTRFLVIDPLTPLLAPILQATSSQGHALMTTIMRQLATLARTYALTTLKASAQPIHSLGQPLLSTSYLESAFMPLKSTPSSLLTVFNPPFLTTTKPALGPSFTFLTDDTLWLSTAPNHILEHQAKESIGAKVFIAEVFRSHTTLSKTWCAFVIRDGISVESFVAADPRWRHHIAT